LVLLTLEITGIFNVNFSAFSFLLVKVGIIQSIPLKIDIMESGTSQ
jgi:hypothetical protein